MATPCDDFPGPGLPEFCSTLPIPQVSLRAIHAEGWPGLRGHVAPAFYENLQC